MQTLFDGKKVLIAPLNWGLGHATRSIPVIQRLLHFGAEVHLAGDGAPLRFLSEVFPDLKVYELPAYNIEYPSGWGGAWKTVFKAPGIIQAIRDEHLMVEQITTDSQIDAIISDNRYGVYSTRIPSVFMGHQLRVLPPKGLRWGSGVILAWHKRYLRNFTEIWVPDFPGEKNLSGILSHEVNTGVPVRYIGPQSRFAEYFSSAKSTEEKIVAVLSGPEPQRTFLEEELIRQLKSIGQPALLVRGVVEKGPPRIEDNLQIVNYLHGDELYNVLRQARCVICRPGYSTIMDLSHIGKKVIFIPTVGQTEQEYLAESLSKKGYAIVQKQSAVHLLKAIDRLETVLPLPEPVRNTRLLDEQLFSLRKRLS